MNLKEQLECPVKQAIFRLTNNENDNGKGLLFMAAGKQCLTAYLKDRGMEFEHYFEQAYANIKFPYEWSYSSAVAEDSFKWKRLVSYIFDCMDAKTSTWVPNANVKLERAYHTIQTVLGYIEIPIIVSVENGKAGVSYHAYYVRNEKNKGYCSNLARKDDNKPVNNPILAAIKESLNHDYPGVVVHCIGLKANNDTTTALEPRLSTRDDAYHSFDEVKEGEMQELIRKNVNRVLQSIDCSQCMFDHEYCHVAKYVEQKGDVIKSPDTVELTPEQQAAVVHDKGPALVCACPGSGKTAVLVKRVQHLYDKGVDPERILLITFSTSAVANLLERVPTLGGESPSVMTIHALCLKILRVRDDSLSVESLETMYSILNSIVRTTKIKGAVSENLYTPQTGFIARLSECIKDIRAGKIANFGGFDGDEIHKLYEQYEEIRKQKNCITYDEMLVQTKEYLEKSPGIAKIFRNKYTYIMVDEYQDVDAVQDAVVRLIAGENGNVMMVGDDDQSIYEFRGGSPTYMINARNNYPGIKTYVLGDNFRSSKQIINCSDMLIRHNTNRLQKNFKAHKDIGKCVDYYSAIELKRDVPILINQFINMGYGYGDIAIISRNNAELRTINAILGRDSSRLNKTLLYQDIIFCTIMAVLELWNDIENASAFLRLVVIHTSVDISKIQGTGISAFHGTDGIWQQEFSSIWSKVRTCVNYMNMENVKIEGIFKVILETFFHIPTHDVVHSMIGWMSEARVRTVLGMYRFVKNLHDIRDDQRRVIYPPDNRVTLLTAHDSKGLEFPCVIVNGLEDFEYGIESERRLLYVAMTRAKERLVVCQTEGSEYSNYWDELQEGV